MNRELFDTIFRKLFVLIFYFSLIVGFLFIPRFLDFLKLNLFSNRTINVYAFMDIIPDELVKKFEEKNGIKVNIKYFDNNEDLLAKFKVSQGIGYDLITVSDYMVDILVSENLLKKIDFRQLSNFRYIDSRLLRIRSDRNKWFSIPYAWYVYGIVYDKKYFSSDYVNWDIIFSPTILRNYKICMLDDALEIVPLASKYLFGKVKNISSEQFLEIESLLIKQKKWIEAYTYSGSERFLMSRLVPVAVVPGTIAKKIIERSSDFGFTIPRIGSLMSIENLAIPKNSEKISLVLQLIDFLISEKGAKLNLCEYGYNPVNRNVYDDPVVKFMKKNMLFPPDYIFDKLYSIPKDIDFKKLNDLWLRIRAK